MADPILRLEPTRLAVEPGGQATLIVTVTNPGTIVEGYSIDVVSTIPMPWVQVNPSTLQVYPQQEATAVIVFAPPAGPGAPGGSLPFGVRVWSEVEGGGSAVAEGDLDIGSVSGLQAKLTPIASSGRWSGRHTLKVTNWGNAPARLRISPEDPDQSLGFLVSPEVIDIPLGGEAVTRLRVRTRHPTLRGTAQRLPFQVACEPDPPPQLIGPRPTTSTPGRPVVDGAFNQKPILTRAVVAVAGLVLVAGLGAAAYALTRHDKAPVGQNRQPDAPTGLVASAKDGIVTLRWQADAAVQSYLLKMVAPTNVQAPISDSAVPGSPGLLESKFQIQATANYCYELVAVGQGGLMSEPSEQQCTDATLPASASSAPTEQASIVPVSSAPSSSGSTGPSAPASDAPLPFISVLTIYVVGAGSSDPQTQADNDAAALSALGYQAKVLFADDYILSSNTFTRSPLGGQPSYMLFVDGQNASDAQNTCHAIRTSVPAYSTAECLAFKVASAPSSPPISPSP